MNRLSARGQCVCFKEAAGPGRPSAHPGTRRGAHILEAHTPACPRAHMDTGGSPLSHSQGKQTHLSRDMGTQGVRQPHTPRCKHRRPRRQVWGWGIDSTYPRDTHEVPPDAPRHLETRESIPANTPHALPPPQGRRHKCTHAIHPHNIQSVKER